VALYDLPKHELDFSVTTTTTTRNIQDILAEPGMVKICFFGTGVDKKQIIYFKCDLCISALRISSNNPIHRNKITPRFTKMVA
jgi:hypothetical protein